MTKKELNAIIKNELKIFGDFKVKLGNEFCYEYETDTVFYDTKPAMTDKLFSQFLLDRFDYIDKYPFIMSLLHEVGHAKNNDDIDGDVYAFCLGEKYKIQIAINKTDDTDDARILNLYYRYFSLPDELMATAWAINYAKKNKKQIKEMNKKITQAVDEYNKTHKMVLA